jgi:hypothetical protein
MTTLEEMSNMLSDDDETLSDFAHNDLYSESNGSKHSKKNDVYVHSYMRTIRRRINDKNVKIIFFETHTTPNSVIRHAMSGDRCDPYKVGTEDEDLFFSVILATGETGQNISVLFYDNPEQYEAHFHTNLSQSAKDLWREKHNQALLRNKNNQLRRQKLGQSGGVQVR